jgi:hypothetical protein
MATRIHVFLSHDLPRFDDASDTIARLDAALPAAFAVRDYWRTADPGNVEVENWAAEPIIPRLPDRRAYTGPGSIFLDVSPKAARISTGGRWRGFLSIEPLRRVHVAAFRAIASALGCKQLAICHDSCNAVEDTFLAGGSQEECIAKLRAALGPPQPSLDSITAEIVQQTEHGVPSVWYLDQ